MGANYTKWEGYKDPETGETKIGLSYPHLCQDVKPGGRILIGDGAVRGQLVNNSHVQPTGYIGTVLHHQPATPSPRY